jgi:hypothetical protein
MYQVIECTVSTGRVTIKSFKSLDRAEEWLKHRENIRAMGCKAGLGSVRIWIEKA